MASGSRCGRESGDYPVTVNEIINSQRCAYQVLDVLGRGTFGQVLKAWRPDTGQLVALKVLKNIPSYTKQGQLEIDVLTRLSCQAAYEFNIVQAYESFCHCGHICISFELLETNLYDYLKQNRFQPLALKHIRPIAQQVLCCLQRLRELGLVHSDIKPENIMLVDQARWPFRVKVIDFGSATSVSAGNATSYLQSRYYRAPEVILSLPYTEAIDMWSLGCVLAELFLGWPLFPGSNEYDQISFIMSILGNPPSSFFSNIRKACKFFIINRHDNQWTLKTPQQMKAESGVVSKETRKYIFTSLSDLTRISSHGNHGQTSLVDQLDRLQFVAFLATMLTFDPSSRSLPSQALQCPFITMQHLAAYTSDHSVRDWIQCMYVCCLSRTTSSSPPNTQSYTPATQQHPPLAPHSMAAHSLILHPPHLPFLPSHPPLLTCAPPHPLTYHLSPISYLSSHCSLSLRHKSSLVSEDTGYGSADSSPSSSRHHSEHVDLTEAQVLFHNPPQLMSSHPPAAALALPHHPHQLYSLQYVPQQRTSAATANPLIPSTTHHLPTISSTLAPHHPFSRL